MTLNHAFLSALRVHPFHPQVGFPTKGTYVIHPWVLARMRTGHLPYACWVSYISAEVFSHAAFPSEPYEHFFIFSSFLRLLTKPEAKRTFCSVQRQMAPNTHIPPLPFCYRTPSRNWSFQWVPSSPAGDVLPASFTLRCVHFWATDCEKKWCVSLWMPQLSFWDITSGGLLDLWFSLINFLIVPGIHCDSPQTFPFKQFSFHCVLLCSFINFSIAMYLICFLILHFIP